MTKEIWINLPSKDVNKARTFFTALPGFTLNEHYGNGDTSASMLVGGKNIVLMLFTEALFSGFTRQPVSNTATGAEVLFSLDAESSEEVDVFARKVREAGGTIYAEPGWNQGWMYGFGFVDTDGHRWNVLYMDFNKMPK